MVQRNVLGWAKERGYKVGFADLSLLDAVRNRLAARRADGEFAPGFYEENLASFKYLEGSEIARPAGLLLAVVPRPAHILSFELGQEKIEAVVPPTYVNYRPFFEEVRRDLINNVLGPYIRIETLHAPLKSLAAWTGLVSYGRNNVTYTPEFGSYFQLVGYLLETPLHCAAHLSPTAEPGLELCTTCRACLKACPMGAITEERFLIHAERCYTLFSESKRPIPDAVRPPSPECLIGCLTCQKVCPLNKGLLRRQRTGITFTTEETEALLRDQDLPDDPIGKAILAKFGTLGLTEDIEVLRRNLRRLLELRSLSFGMKNKACF